MTTTTKRVSKEEQLFNDIYDADDVMATFGKKYYPFVLKQNNTDTFKEDQSKEGYLKFIKIRLTSLEERQGKPSTILMTFGKDGVKYNLDTSTGDYVRESGLTSKDIWKFYYEERDTYKSETS